MRAAFLTNPVDFDAPVNGGVQICSQEYYGFFTEYFDEIRRFDVLNSSHLVDRARRRLGLERYLNHNPERNKEILRRIVEWAPDVILINHCQLLRYTKALKMHTEAPILLLSHGNQSGDDLYELSSKNGRLQQNGRAGTLARLAFGSDIIMESTYRRYYIDGVVTMSQEECVMEAWLGSSNTFYFPRLIEKETLKWEPKLNRIGFIGTLNHTPNQVALRNILNWLEQNAPNQIEVRIIGNGHEIGHNLSEKFAFVSYLGALNDDDAQREISTWGVFLNPIFWLSRGSSMKLKKAMNWGIPTVSTRFGARGYEIIPDLLCVTDNSVEAFCTEVLRLVQQPEAQEVLRRAILDYDVVSSQSAVRSGFEKFLSSLT